MLMYYSSLYSNNEAESHIYFERNFGALLSQVVHAFQYVSWNTYSSNLVSFIDMQLLSLGKQVWHPSTDSWGGTHINSERANKSVY